MKSKAAARRQLGVGICDGADRRFFHVSDELLLHVDAVCVDGAGGMVIVRGVQQQMIGRDPALFFDLFGHVVEHLPADANHVASDDGELARTGCSITVATARSWPSWP